MSKTAPFRCAIIVSSDRASRGKYRDESGPAAEQWLTDHGYVCQPVRVIEDDQAALRRVLDEVLSDTDVIVISGGTGLGPRDITPQTLDAWSDYAIPGLGEHLRRESLKYSLNAALSRGGGWAKNNRLVLALPGNPKAVSEQLAILDDLIEHAVYSLRGECRHRHSDSQDDDHDHHGHHHHHHATHERKHR